MVITTNATLERWQMGALGRLRKSWEYGGRGERFVAAWIVSAPVVGLAMAVTAFLLPISSSEIGVILVATLMAILGQPIFLPVQFEAVFSPAFWDACIVHGWMPSYERAYYAELARYQRTYGNRTGRLPGDLLWATGYVAVYLATVLLALLLTLALYPYLTTSAFLAFVPVEVGIAVVCFKLYLRRDRARLRLAAERGFHLRELGKEMARLRKKQLSASQQGAGGR